jgi:molybdate transport system substrate-binding protein
VRLCASIALVALVSCAWVNKALPNELNVLSVGEMASSFRQIIPEFVKSSDHNVVVEYASASTIAQRVLRDEKVDIILVTGPHWPALLKAKKVESPTLIASFGLGLGVQAGKLADVADLKKGSWAVKTIGIVSGETDTTSARLREILQRQGLLIEGKIKLYNSWFDLAAALSRGDVDVGLAPTLSLAEAGVSMVVDLPPEIRKPQFVSAFVSSGTSHKEAARTFIKFLRSSKAQEMLKATGVEPTHVNEPSVPQPTSQERRRRLTEFAPRLKHGRM